MKDYRSTPLILAWGAPELVLPRLDVLAVRTYVWPCKPEVDEVELRIVSARATGLHDDVSRLDVAVDESSVMEALQTVKELGTNLRGPGALTEQWARQWNEWWNKQRHG